MNYLIGIALALALVICVVSFPVASLIGIAVAAVWWFVKTRDKGVS